MPKSRNNRKNKKNGNHSDLVSRRKTRLDATYASIISRFNEVMNKPENPIIEEPIENTAETSVVLEPEIIEG